MIFLRFRLAHQQYRQVSFSSYPLQHLLFADFLVMAILTGVTLFVYLLDKDNKVKYSEIKVDPQNDGNNYIVTEGLKNGDKFVTNGITKLTDGMEIVPITQERYQQKIQEQNKAMSAGDIVGAMKK